MKINKIWVRQFEADSYRPSYYGVANDSEEITTIAVNVHLEKCGSVENDCIFIDEDKLKIEAMRVCWQVRGTDDGKFDYNICYDVYINNKFCIFINHEMRVDDIGGWITFNEFIIKSLLE